MRDVLTSIVDGVCDEGYVIVENFIAPDLQRALRADALSAPLRPAAIGRLEQTQLNQSIRGDAIAWLNGENNTQRQYLHGMEQLRLAINSSLFLGLFDYECHYARYQPGQFYQKHRDAFAGSDRQPKSRVLTTVCYLNDAWHENDGGALILYDEHDNEITRVTPAGGTLVVFLAERFPHEVAPARKDRLSVTGWFRRS